MHAISAAGQESVCPTKQQLAWQDWEFGMFCHFGLYIFGGPRQETVPVGGHCPEGDPRAFNPTAFDPDQWVETAVNAGMKYLVLTCKHHDGFCLWPTATTEHSVKNSPWRNGQGDVVKDVAEACHRAGMPFCTYMSGWDFNCEFYTDEKAYDDFFVQQLTELLTNYGEIGVVWFDLCGSKGHRYDLERIAECIHTHQPNANVHGLGEMTTRWVGNERGLAPYPCWNVVQLEPSLHVTERCTSQPGWWPAECDVPIRRDWFWYPDNIDTLKSLEELLDIYYRSIGHGTNLLLNLAPTPRGLLDEADVRRLHELSDEIEARFSAPLAATEGAGHELILELSQPTTVNHAVLQEDLSGSERVCEYVLEARTPAGWESVYEGSAIGHKHIASFPEITAEAFRLRVTQAVAEPLIRSFSLHRVTGFIPEPTDNAPMDI